LLRLSRMMLRLPRMRLQLLRQSRVLLRLPRMRL
jgi:hypothetical protein